MGATDISSRMERDWDARAREAPEHYIASARREWEIEEFFRSGQINVDNEVLADDEVIRLGKQRRSLAILEVGCGAGRMTRALAAAFGEVHAVDISAEMIALARRNLDGLSNVHLHKNSGQDLAGLPDSYFNFAFSFIVFQHIPSRDVIESYLREVNRCLKPGAVFKFQVRGDSGVEPEPTDAQFDTWTGASISLDWATAAADRCGFETIRAQGEGTEYFWLWFRKPGPLPEVSEDEPETVSASFSPACVLPGESYSVSIPALADHTVDVTWELASGASGVLSKWCELDAQGEARLMVSPDHPPGVVRITRLRSNTLNGRWHRTTAAIEVGDALG